MFRVVISSLDNKTKYNAFWSHNEVESNQVFNQCCNLMEQNANRNNIIDQKVLLMFEVSILKSFVPQFKEKK